jgi:hypothetical protein
MGNTPTWMSWRSMVHRCFREKDSSFKRYAGKGITCCRFLRKSPLNLVKSIGLRPNGTTIDRINNHGNYTCGKCGQCKSEKWTKNIRWETPLVQARNRNNVISVLVDGKVWFLSDIAKQAKSSYNAILYRHRRGVSGKDLFSQSQKTPINLEGKKFGNLKVVSYSGITKGQTYWDCACKCGTIKRIREGNLKSGNSTSCRIWCPFGDLVKYGRGKHGKLK